MREAITMSADEKMVVHCGRSELNQEILNDRALFTGGSVLDFISNIAALILKLVFVC